MIHRFQLFFKQRFNCCYILERNRAFFEIPFRYLCVNNLIYSVLMLSSVYSGRLREAASTESAIIRTACSLVNGFGPG